MVIITFICLSSISSSIIIIIIIIIIINNIGTDTIDGNDKDWMEAELNANNNANSDGKQTMKIEYIEYINFTNKKYW